TGAWYGGSSPHQPRHSSSHSPRTGPNMLRPLLKARAATIGAPSSPVSSTRSNCQRWSRSPPTPSGSSRDWSGPATNPSRDTVTSQVTRFIASSSTACTLPLVGTVSGPEVTCNQFSREGGLVVERRSGCPINLSLEVIGDRWSLLVIRDIVFGRRRHYRELLTRSEEGIASNILGDRLRRLVDAGLLTRTPDPSHRQKRLYSLTEPAIQLVPVLAQLGAWGRRHLPVTPELSIRAQVLEEGGPALWEDLMDELREIHLGIPRPAGTPSVLERLQTAYEQALAEQAAG